MRTPILLLAATMVLVFTPALAQAQDETPLEQTIYLHENLHIVPERINARQGDTISAHVINAGQTPHDILFCGDGVNAASTCKDRWSFVRLDPGQEANISVPVKKAGTFDYFCSIPGHKQGGMRGELIVQSSGEEKKSPIPTPTILAVGGLAVVALALRDRRRAT